MNTKFRKKPVVIDAFRVSFGNLGELQKWVESLGDKFDEHFILTDQGPDGASLKVKTLEGSSYDVQPGYWIIRGVKGEYYPCESTIFDQTYEPA